MKFISFFLLLISLFVILAPLLVRADATEIPLETEENENDINKIIKILGISGSLRHASVNTGLLRYIEKYLKRNPSAHPNIEFKIANISNLPLYNQDDDVGQGGGGGKKTNKHGIHPEVEKFRRIVSESDAFIFGVVEHNYGVSAAMKNALDWASRGHPRGNVWRGKAAGMVGSGGQSGAARAMLAMRQIGAFLDLHFVNAPEVAINRFNSNEKGIFDEDTGDLISEVRQNQVIGMFERTVKLAKKLME